MTTIMWICRTLIGMLGRLSTPQLGLATTVKVAPILYDIFGCKTDIVYTHSYHCLTHCMGALDTYIETS